MFEGVLSALVTPFKDNGSQIDTEAWKSLIEWQIACGVGGLVVFGTTGESATLSVDEKLHLAETAVQVANGRLPIVAGSGSNNTNASVNLSKQLKTLGVDGVLAVTPYYNKPTQEGIFQHFSAIANEGGLPVVLYNIPSRTNLTISMETFARLAQNPNIVGLKQAADSVSDLLELSKILETTNVNLLAGDDPLVYSVMSVGGKGVISASANVLPEEFVSLVSAAQSSDMQTALKIQQDLLPKIRALFLETNPSPAKFVLKKMGRIPCSCVRLPLVEVSDTTADKLSLIFGLE
jgi:4-hydroxy-tetrahydrodipicolinate synthase